MTSGFFAGEEAVRDADGARFHKQQSPIASLLRIILSSSNVGDMVFDLFAGTGTTSLVAHQIQRQSTAAEIDLKNTKYIEKRLSNSFDFANIKFVSVAICCQVIRFSMRFASLFHVVDVVFF